MTSTSIWNVDEIILRRVRDWRRLLGETGHSGERNESFRADHNSVYTGSYSVFPAPLVEWILLRYAPEGGGRVLDSFAGGPPRGVVAGIMGYSYTGVEIRQRQIDENIAVCKQLGLPRDKVSYWLADGRFLEIPTEGGHDKGPLYDIALTCPPYYDLEVYSDNPNDLSTMSSYAEFNAGMWLCAHAHRTHMRAGAFVCIVVGNFRDPRTGEIIDFRADTVENFRDAGFVFWQEIILSKNFGSAAQRSTNAWKGLKLVPRHEFLLVFRTPGWE